MKYYILYILAVFISSGLCAQSLRALNSYNDSLDYSLGVYVGNWMAQEGMTINDLQLFNQGMLDFSSEHQLAIDDSIIHQLITTHQLSLQIQYNRQMEAKLFSNLKEKNGVGALPIGVRYIILEEGDGKRPDAHDSIVYNVIGLFPDGTIFENTNENGKPISSSVANLIPGLRGAVQLMKEGAVWRVFVPSLLGYGSAGLGKLIPPEMALIYDISLEQVIENKISN